MTAPSLVTAPCVVLVEPPYCARFPISGRIVRPTAADYDREVERLGEAGRAIHVRPRGSRQPTEYGRLRELARIYARLARRKRWAEDIAAGRERHREEAA